MFHLALLDAGDRHGGHGRGEVLAAEALLFPQAAQ
jgi:hypothetical protein